MKKVYLVVSSNYEGVDIYGAYSTEALAQKFAEAMPNAYDAEVTEWELDAYAAELCAGKKSFWVRMDRAGVVSDMDVASAAYRENDGQVGDEWLFYVWATDKTAAVALARRRNKKLQAREGAS